VRRADWVAISVFWSVLLTAFIVVVHVTPRTHGAPAGIRDVVLFWMGLMFVVALLWLYHNMQEEEADE